MKAESEIERVPGPIFAAIMQVQQVLRGAIDGQRNPTVINQNWANFDKMIFFQILKNVMYKGVT